MQPTDYVVVAVIIGFLAAVLAYDLWVRRE